MERPGLGLDDESRTRGAAAAPSPGHAHRLSVLRCIEWLVHACGCRRAGCSLAPCQKLKRVVQHTKGCTWRTNRGCPICKQLIALCCYHAKFCQEHTCPVLLCPHIKRKLQQAQALCRGTASGHRAGLVGQQQGPPSPTPATPAPGQAAQPPFLGPPPAAVEVAVHGQRAAETWHPTAQAEASQRLIQLQTSQVTPMAPLGMNPPPMARGPGGHLERGTGPTGMQQGPLWAHGGLPQAWQQQAGMPRPATMSVVQLGQPLNVAPEPELGQLAVPGLRPGTVSPQALQNLLRILRSPFSPVQQQQVLSILHANPQLLAAFIKQRATKYANANLQPLPGQPGMPQGQPGLQPPAMPGQQGVHSSPVMQNMNPMQAGVQRAGLPQPQPQPQQQPQPPIGGTSPQAQRRNVNSVNSDTMLSQFRDSGGRQQGTQQTGKCNQFQKSQGASYSPPQWQRHTQRVQHHMQQVQQGDKGQVGQLSQALGAEAGARLQAYRQRLLQQQRGSPAQPNPMSLRQRVLPNQAQSPHPQSRQIPPSPPNQVGSPQPVPSPRPRSQLPRSSPSPRMRPQPSPQQVFP